MSAVPFVHLTSCTPSAEHVEALLAELGREEHVLELADEMPNEGPLHDIDLDSASRAAWRRRILGDEADTFENADFDDMPLWRSVVSGDEKVVLWHGLHPAERILSLRACWHLREQAHRVHEVALPKKSESLGARHLPGFYGNVWLASRDELAQGLAACARVPADEVARRAAHWESARDVEGDWIHHIEGEGLVKRPVTVYDDALLEACGSDWTNARRALARVVAMNPTGLWVPCWRLRVLVETGVLESRPYESDADFPEQLRVRAG